MIRSYKTEGIIIKRRNFRETDRIVTVFTRLNGKIQVKAPGVRRITSRRSSHIELLNFSVLTLYKSPRLSFPILTEAQALEEFLPIKNTLQRIGLAYYICELIDRLCPENQENKKIFFLIKETLFSLCCDANSSMVSDFEKKLLVMLGFLPESHRLEDNPGFIEHILERRLNTTRILPLFLDKV